MTEDEEKELERLYRAGRSYVALSAETLNLFGYMSEGSEFEITKNRASISCTILNAAKVVINLCVMRHWSLELPKWQIISSIYSLAKNEKL